MTSTKWLLTATCIALLGAAGIAWSRSLRPDPQPRLLDLKPPASAASPAEALVGSNGNAAPRQRVEPSTERHVLASSDDSFEVLVLDLDGRPATDVRLLQRARVGNSIGLNAPLHPGRTRASEIEHVATSPSLQLSRSAFVARECWIGAADLEWRRAEIPPAEVSRVEMRLRPAGALQVDLKGLDAADAASVRVYATEGPPTLIADVQIGLQCDSLTFDGIAAGAYSARLEPRLQPLQDPLDRQDVAIERGGRSIVHLTATSPGPVSMVEITGEIALSDDVLRVADLRLELQPVEPSSLHWRRAAMGEEIHVDDTKDEGGGILRSFRFHPVLPGEYSVVLSPLGFRWRIDVQPGEPKHVFLETGTLAITRVRFRDAVSGDAASPLDITAMIEGRGGVANALVRTAGTEAGELEVLSPPGRLGILCQDKAAAAPTVTQDVVAGPNVVDIALRACGRLRLEVRRAEDVVEPGLEFWSGVHVRTPESAGEISRMLWTTARGTSVLELVLPASVPCAIEVPRLEGEVSAPIQVTLAAGERRTERIVMEHAGRAEDSRATAR
jgi:hypothetical protein